MRPISKQNRNKQEKERGGRGKDKWKRFVGVCSLPPPWKPQGFNKTSCLEASVPYPAHCAISRISVQDFNMNLGFKILWRRDETLSFAKPPPTHHCSCLPTPDHGAPVSLGDPFLVSIYPCTFQCRICLSEFSSDHECLEAPSLCQQSAWHVIDT